MPRYVGLSGTPGTGKKSIAPLIARKLGIPAYSLSELATDYGAVGEGPGFEVDCRLLGRKILREIDHHALMFGHLLPQVFHSRAVSKVVVLRCEPTVLKARLESRGYGPEKVRENVEAELIGVVSSACIESFGAGKVFEVDTTKTDPVRGARACAFIIEHGAPKKWIDWTTRYGSARKLRSLLERPGSDPGVT